MIHDTIINMQDDDAPSVEIFYDDNETPITKEAYEREIARVGNICPVCGSRNYGFFAPFAERGIDAWCAECGYSHGDKKTIKGWYDAHPERVIETC